ncbi:uncharacterized protein LOC129587732 isoform X2 [Paramacrobiotus metropolitanus]|uniref:uncharacterized protein LOC129587732 isoform X2 n=1 Tax=Paramacrobiotus metropolitanus TaxID=2943436 RepID=UPI0024455E91|nr:uncharacterized protein LOC129587732 isoform X2 [Paramacrobiotus metropolitanus]
MILTFIRRLCDPQVLYKYGTIMRTFFLRLPVSLIARKFSCQHKMLDRSYVAMPSLKRYGSEQFEKSFGYCSILDPANELDRKAKIVDMRSDTVTQPTPEMREAMAHAIVGDDVYLEDPTVRLLESTAADMLGKESALFVPSGTMGNLISVMIHCQDRGSEVLLGDKSHIFMYEQGGISQFGGVHARTLNNLRGGTFLVDEMVSKIRTADDIHYPRTRLLCLENTHNMCGGKVLPLAFLTKVTKRAKENGVPAIHMDGARLFNAAVALNVPITKLLENIDSASVCLSKGLCAPAGSLIVGSDKFIAEARRLRKALGGGMRQAGILAAAGLISLEKMTARLEEDHSRAQRLAEAIANYKSPFFRVDVQGVHTNIILIDLQTDRLPPSKFCKRLVSATEQEVKELGETIYVRMFPFGHNIARAVVHNNLKDVDIEMVMSKLQYVADELQETEFVYH